MPASDCVTESGHNKTRARISATTTWCTRHDVVTSSKKVLACRWVSVGGRAEDDEAVHRNLTLLKSSAARHFARRGDTASTGVLRQVPLA